MERMGAWRLVERRLGNPRPAAGRAARETGHVRAIDTQIAGLRMRIDARRALFWSDENALLIADLHLGKASLLRQAGTALPPGTTLEGLARLSSLIADYCPQRLLILGDLVHGAESHGAQWLEIFAAWR